MVRGGSAVSSDGARIVYLAVGTGPRLVFLHGGLGQGWAYKDVAEHLAGRYESVLVDRRGHGRSDWGTEPYTLEREADDVAAVVGRVGPIAGLVGHSYGGAVALVAALRDGAGTTPKLVVYEPATAEAWGGVEDVAASAAIRDAVARGEYEEAMRINDGQSVRLGMASAQTLERLRASPMWLQFVALAPTLTWNEQLKLWPASRFRSISVPTLVLWGADSPAPLHAAAREVAAAIPGASSVGLPGQAHLANHLAPGQFAEAIARFLG